jgi:hypothetical protein
MLYNAPDISVLEDETFCFIYRYMLKIMTTGTVYRYLFCDVENFFILYIIKLNY